MKRTSVALLLACLSVAARAQTLNGLCMLAVSQYGQHASDTADIMLRGGDCSDDRHDNCGEENSNIAWTRWSGVSPRALQQEGAQLNAVMSAEAGELRCSGTVHDGVLAGRYQFTPSAAFAQKMTAMGFDGVTPRKQEGFLMLDVTTAWMQQMKDGGVTGLTTNHLMGLRALGVDLDYIHAMAAAGYPELSANKLTQMKAVGVTPEKAKEARAMGFQPTEQELVQMSIFKIDRPFVERMRARGLGDLSLSKLIQIKIFKLDD